MCNKNPGIGSSLQMMESAPLLMSTFKALMLIVGERHKFDRLRAGVILEGFPGFPLEAEVDDGGAKVSGAVAVLAGGDSAAGRERVVGGGVLSGRASAPGFVFCLAEEVG
jgi:hypothetical protein